MGADTGKVVRTMGDLAVIGIATGIAMKTMDWSIEHRKKSRSNDLFSL